MTSQEYETSLQATHVALKSEFGSMVDLPYELANSVANVYFRYFQMAFDHSPPISAIEMNTRRIEYESVPEVISNFRIVVQKCDDEPLLKDFASCITDVFQYRMHDAGSMIPLRRMIERKFKKSQDYPDLIRVLQLYK